MVTQTNNDKVERLEIHENVVSCDYIERADDGYTINHGGKQYKWKLVYYTYATEWTDKEHTYYGDTLEDVLKHYPKERLNDAIDDEWTTSDLIDNYMWTNETTKGDN